MPTYSEFSEKNCSADDRLRIKDHKIGAEKILERLCE